MTLPATLNLQVVAKKPRPDAQGFSVPRGIEGEPLTWEGQIRLAGRLGTGASELPRWLRWTMTGILMMSVVALLVVMVIGFIRLGL